MYVQETYEISKRRLGPLSSCGSQVEESVMLVLTATSSLYSDRPAKCTPYRPPRAPEGLESSWTPIYLFSLFQGSRLIRKSGSPVGNNKSHYEALQKGGMLLYMNTQMAQVHILNLHEHTKGVKDRTI